MPGEINQENLAESFRACVKKTLEDFCQTSFVKEPKVTTRDIIEYESRMRVFGLEKFNDTCFIAFQTLYESPLEQEKSDVCGTLLVYVQEENAERLFKALLKEKDPEDEEIIIECVRNLCRALFDHFKTTATRFGYANLLGSEVENYMSNIEEGAPFPYSEDTLYQVVCTLWREKVVVAELVLASSQRG